MHEYLQEFYEKLKKWKGSLVKVKTIKKIEPNAKEYLNNLAKSGKIKRIKWGWYWIPDDVKDLWDFLIKDKNFKIISAQSAASFWNYDFVHRNVYVMKIKDKSFGKALKEFAKQRGWNVVIKHIKTHPKIKFTRIGNLLIEGLEHTIVDCLQNWAFMDAFATLYANRERIKFRELLEKSNWKRISGSNMRVRQALVYGCSRANELIGKKIFPTKKKTLRDEFIKGEIDEAVEKVVELG